MPFRHYRKLLVIGCFSALVAGCDSGAVATDSTYATDSSAQAAAAGISHGEYVARLGNCVACHSIPEGEPLAGGLRMNVPMLGNLYTTNITPDPATGIGSYSFDEFDRAMRFGVKRDGTRMYPAMPYPSYAKMSEQDMRALYDFIMNEVEPVNAPNQPSEIPGWKDMARQGMGLWNLMTMDDDPYEPNNNQSDDWNRGAYLVQGLGHCGACHTPRGLLMQEKGLDEGDSAFLAGAPLDHWSASSLNGDIKSGLGSWNEDDVAEFMGSGHNRFGTAFGTMVEVVNNSTQHMSDADLRAMAVYLKSLPPVAEVGATAWSYDNSDTEELLALDFSEPGSQIYYEYCSNCHGTNGQGYYFYQLLLAGNPVLMDPDPSSLINLTLNGSLRVIADQGPDVNDMPYFRQLLSDDEIAEVVTYIRSAWGHDAPAVSTGMVSEIRAATDPSRNDDIFVLRMK
jgi:mono/diheme cytochrome c family protein